MSYKLKWAYLIAHNDNQAALADLAELERVYLESESYLGKLSSEKRNAMTKSINYCRGLVDVNIAFQNDPEAERLTAGFLRIA